MLDVHLVTPEAEVWAGQASLVIARTVEGDIGVLDNHEPTLAVLGGGQVTIRATDGPDLVAQLEGGFISVGRDEQGNTRVDLLAEQATTS